MNDPSDTSHQTGPTLGTGDRIGRYEIIRPVGRGGMGEVYLAEDTLLHRQVALKRVGLDLAGDPDQSRSRLLEEAQRASSLSGGRIASVYDLLHEGGDRILVMEFIPGRTLREVMDEPVGLDMFWDIALQCAEALQAAHREGLVHRDIKPDNIILTPSGSVRLIDFGIAHRFKPSRDSTTRVADLPIEEGKGIVGTPSYMAPEALRGQAVSRRSDVFSLGVVFHELLAGRRPFRGDTTLSVVAQILHAEPEPLSEAAPQAPLRLVTVIQRMLAKDPARRPSSAGELLEELVAARRDSSGVATERLPRPKRRRSWPWRPVAAGLAVLVVLGGVFELNDPAYRIPLQRLFGMNVLPARKHVAVLPPEVIDRTPRFEAFSLGLTEFLAGQLMKLTGDSTLQVASPGLVRYYEVQDVADARAEMGANLALRLRLQEAGDGWRAHLTLSDTRNGQTLAERDVAAGDRDALALAAGVYAASRDMLQLDHADSAASLAFGTEAAGAFAACLEGTGLLHAAVDSAGLQESMSAFSLARGMDPQCPGAAVGLAQAALRMNRVTRDDRWVEEAERHSRDAVALDGSRPEAHLALANTLARSGQVDRAVAEFRRVVELDPTSEDGYFQLANLWAARGDYDRAEAVFDDAVKARPHAWPAYWRRGLLNRARGRLGEAERDFRRLIAADPDNFRGYANLGGLLVWTGRYAEAAEVLERAQEIKLSDTVLSNLATAYFNQRRFEDAINGYQKALNAGRSSHEVWGNLGDAYYWAPGKRDLARAPYEQAIRLGRQYLEDPAAHSPVDRALALAYLANIYPKLGEADSAAVYLDRALALSPDDYDVQYYAALVERQLGRSQRALDHLEKSVAGGYPRVWLRDSPVFDDWRGDQRFRELAAGEGAPAPENSNQGG